MLTVRVRSGALFERNKMIIIRGGKKHERDAAEKIIQWCFDNKVVVRHGIDIDMKICKYSTYKCWGTCVDSFNDIDMSSFDITIANDQSIRDFVATIIHEMVHVNQYITGEWDGDGESEAEYWQYKLADKFWKEGVL
jgi:hypothetical protein